MLFNHAMGDACLDAIAQPKQKRTAQGHLHGQCTMPTAAAATLPPSHPTLVPRLPPPQVPDYLKRDCLLFYYPDCEQLARRIVECSNGSVELAEIQWK